MNNTQNTNSVKDASVANLLWMDLEMTGLTPTTDKILEVAVIATRFDFVEIERYESGVWQNEQEIRELLNANPFSVARPIETEQEIQTSLKGKAESIIQEDLLALIKRRFGDEPVYLAGNSIHADRGFVRQYWPKLHARLHYRMLDVSSFKLVWLGRGGEPFAKKEKHTALADIEESIAELKYYLSTNILGSPQ